MSETTEGRRWRTRIAIAAFALTVRLVAIGLYPVVTSNDPSEYLSIGWNIRHSGTFSFGEPHKWGADAHYPGKGPILPTAARAPLFPALIAALWNSEEAPVRTIQLAHAAMGTATALLIFEIGLSVFGLLPATIAAFAFGIAPLSVQTGTQILSEPVFVFLTTGALYFWIRKRFVVAGLAFGLAILAKAVLLPFIPLMAAVLFFRRSRAALLMPLCALLMVTPWTIRNVLVVHRLVAVNTEGWGSVLLQGSLLVPYGSGQPFRLYGKDPAAVEAIESTSDESAAEAKMFAAAMDRIRANPGRWVVIRLIQYPRLFLDPGTALMEMIGSTRVNSLIKVLSAGGNLLVIVLAVAGGWMARRERDAFPVIALPVFLALVAFPGNTQTRYSVPMMPSILLLAGFAIARIFRLKAGNEFA